MFKSNLLDLFGLRSCTPSLGIEYRPREVALYRLSCGLCGSRWRSGHLTLGTTVDLAETHDEELPSDQGGIPIPQDQGKIPRFSPQI